MVWSFLERKLWKSHFKSCEFPSRISSSKTKKNESCCHQVAIRFCTWCTHFRSVPTPSTVVTDIPWQATNGFKPQFDLMESQVGIIGCFAIKWWSMIQMIFEYDMNMIILYMNIICMNMIIIYYHDISVNICQPTLSIRFQLWSCCWEAAVNWSIDPTSCCQVILLNSNLETNCIGWSEKVQSSTALVVRFQSLHFLPMRKSSGIICEVKISWGDEVRCHYDQILEPTKQPTTQAPHPPCRQLLSWHQ